MREARTAASDRAVLVQGALQHRPSCSPDYRMRWSPTVQVLLGDGRHLLDGLKRRRIELELVRRLDDRDVTHLRYQVVGSGDDTR